VFSEYWVVVVVVTVVVMGVFRVSAVPVMMVTTDLFLLLLRRRADEDLEIELVEEEPPFLRGHTKQSMDMSPVKIVKVRRDGRLRLIDFVCYNAGRCSSLEMSALNCICGLFWHRFKTPLNLAVDFNHLESMLTFWSPRTYSRISTF